MTATATASVALPVPAEEPVVGNYFVAAYPPFSVWSPAEVSEVEQELNRAVSGSPVGIYVHVPFCQKKCDYCYYLSYIGQKPEVVDRYVEAVLREMALYAGRPGVQTRPVSFVYFGGGTPSTLTSSQVRRLGNGLRSALAWDSVEEVTFECAPRSVRRDFLEALIELGVTRVSMGVQSFDNALLKLNGRIHLAEDVRRAYTQIQQAGFDWVNLDLMVGLIGETRTQWEDSVRQMIGLSPDSVTIYQTEIPCNTRLYSDLKSNRLPGTVVSWAEKRERLNYAFGKLDQAGYTVVNAYAAVKDPVRHRFRYQDHLWRGEDMLGLGVASFGYLGGVHFQNAVTLEAYVAHVEQGALPLTRAYRLSPHDQFVREFILQLKFGSINAADFRNKFGEDIIEVFGTQLQALAAAGLLKFSNSSVLLTGEGLLQVDRLLPLFYHPQFQEVRYT
ncbi:MAG: coproporphyrinogen III oxidase family protein [Verrucomicrobia bacterium]|nr:coproporphyrinogen III oxidase family protein [Verrucomicrobiota bacterium]